MRTDASRGAGDGGNITLNAETIVQLGNSDITANAIKGKGGNININTQGIFSDFDSEITATSERGINGMIKITTPDVKQENSLQQQSTNFTGANEVIATSCLQQQNVPQGRFVVTGNGGLEVTPNNSFDLTYSVAPIHSTTQSFTLKAPKVNTSLHSPWKLGNEIVEATNLVRTNSGKLTLTTLPTASYHSSEFLICE
jgi:large exoprotein involved in heme utilization and adhesion